MLSFPVAPRRPRTRSLSLFFSWFFGSSLSFSIPLSCFCYFNSPCISSSSVFVHFHDTIEESHPPPPRVLLPQEMLIALLDGVFTLPFRSYSSKNQLSCVGSWETTFSSWSAACTRTWTTHSVFILTRPPLLWSSFLPLFDLFFFPPAHHHSLGRHLCIINANKKCACIINREQQALPQNFIEPSHKVHQPRRPSVIVYKNNSTPFHS